MDNHKWFIDAHHAWWGNLLEFGGFLLLTAITMIVAKILNKWKWTRFLVLGQSIEIAGRKL